MKKHIAFAKASSANRDYIIKRFIAYGGPPVLPDDVEEITQEEADLLGFDCTMVQLQGSFAEAADALKSANELFEERKKELDFLRMELHNLQVGIWNEMSNQNLDNIVVSGVLLSRPDDDNFLVGFTPVTIL